MIAIVDYDVGNVKSVEKALQYIGENPVVTRDREELLKADKVIVYQFKVIIFAAYVI